MRARNTQKQCSYSPKSSFRSSMKLRTTTTEEPANPMRKRAVRICIPKCASAYIWPFYERGCTLQRHCEHLTNVKLGINARSCAPDEFEIPFLCRSGSACAQLSVS